MGTIRQEPIVGFHDNDRMFFVSLMEDKTYTFTWLNGVALTEVEKKSYCIQIVNAQNKLENVQMYILRGRGMAQYGPWYSWPYSLNDEAGVKSKTIKYFGAGKVDRPVSAGNCKIRTKADLDL